MRNRNHQQHDRNQQNNRFGGYGQSQFARNQHGQYGQRDDQSYDQSHDFSHEQPSHHYAWNSGSRSAQNMGGRYEGIDFARNHTPDYMASQQGQQGYFQSPQQYQSSQQYQSPLYQESQYQPMRSQAPQYNARGTTNYAGMQNYSDQGYGGQSFGSQRYSAQNYSTPSSDTSSREWNDSWRHRQDEETRGRFFGKGPKGYKRSDERIKEEACQALWRHSDIDASDVEVSVADGVATLSGTVPERQMKRMAESAIENLEGVDDVRNEIKVKRMDETLAQSQTGAGSTSTTATTGRGEGRSFENQKSRPGSRNTTDNVM